MKRLSIVVGLVAAFGVGGCSDSADAPTVAHPSSVIATPAPCVDAAKFRHWTKVTRHLIDLVSNHLEKQDYSAGARMVANDLAHGLRFVGGKVAYADYSVAKGFFDSAESFQNAASTMEGATAGIVGASEAKSIATLEEQGSNDFRDAVESVEGSMFCAS
jgi:hypothetical protein